MITFKNVAEIRVILVKKWVKLEARRGFGILSSIRLSNWKMGRRYFVGAP